MNCPVCDEKMREISRHGVEIDICPSCKGIWLDKGELDKILEIAGSKEAEPRRDVEPPSQEPERRREYDEHDRRDRGREEYRGERRDDYEPRKRRKGSWLSDILEGFGGDD